MNDIETAQVEAGENAVVERLRRKGLMPPEEDGVWRTVEERQRAESVAIFQRQQLEHTLATRFIELQSKRNPARRQEAWTECLRLAGEIRRLSE